MVIQDGTVTIDFVHKERKTGIQYLIRTPNNNLIQTRINLYSLRDTVARSEGTVQATDTPITKAEALSSQETTVTF
jgi:hypothetical protein